MNVTKKFFLTRIYFILLDTFLFYLEYCYFTGKEIIWILEKRIILLDRKIILPGV